MFAERVGGRLKILFLPTALAEEYATLDATETVGGSGRGFIGCNIGGCE